MTVFASSVFEGVSAVASSGTGTITLSGTGQAVGDGTTGRTFASALGANAEVTIRIIEGSAWEECDSTYTHSGTTLSRGTLRASSTGSRVTFNTSGTGVKVALVAGQTWFTGTDVSIRSHIAGLELAYASSSSITCSPGSAYIEGLGRVYEVTSTITLSGLSSLSASTLYHIYLYDNSGTPTLEASTTAPASTAFAGTARSKTSDTTRRYLGTIRTTSAGSNNIPNFMTNVSGRGQLAFFWLNNDVSFSRVINGTGKTTAATSQSLSGLMPATVCTEMLVALTAAVSSGSGAVNIIFGLANSNSFRVAVGGFSVGSSVDFPSITLWCPVLPATPSFYWYNAGGDSANSLTYVDLMGFKVAR